MTVRANPLLLDEREGSAVLVENTGGTGPFLIVCDHASNAIPASLDALGLSETALESHAAWDPGAYGIALEMARLLDAPLFRAGFSRLVYDVNRPPDSPEAIRETSEIYDVPGNRGLSQAARQARVEAIYEPYHSRLAALLDERSENARTSVLIAIHSFTPVYHGQEREVQLGVLHDLDSRLADAVLARAPRYTSLKTERNQPYGPTDGVTHTLQKHAVPRGLPNVMIEVRNDLITSESEQTAIAQTLSNILAQALNSVLAENSMPGGAGGNDAPSD
ncbi:MAG: N-formylglutamate amidohydrolase [Hyphomicrobiales bacterium]|nr:N-formylglutamate amidohydrolase [Hyphomicrobiales bacterium]